MTVIRAQRDEDQGQVPPRSFNFGASEVRLVRIDQHGFGWFVARDVLRILGLAGRSSLTTLPGNAKAFWSVITRRGPRKMSVVSEKGLYQLICMSRKPTAKVFRQWLYDEILPSIRQTGRYAQDDRSLGLIH